MAIPLTFSEKIASPFFISVRKSLLFVELMALGYLIYEARGDLTIILMACIISSWHLIIYTLSKYCNINLYAAGLLISFLVILYFNSLAGQDIAFVSYIVPLVFYSFFFIESFLVQYIYVCIFIIGACTAEFLKGVDLNTILMVLIPAMGFGTLFMNALHHLQDTQVKLLDQNKELSDSKSSLDALIENTNSLIWCIDKNYCYLRGNLKFKKTLLSTFNSDVNIGDNLLDLPNKEDERQFWKNLYDRGIKGETFSSESSFDFGNERVYWEHHINPMRNKNGEVYGVTILAKDISKKKDFERQRKENEQLLNLIINKMPIGFELFDENGLAIMMNEVQKDNLGLRTIDEAVGRYNVLDDPLIRNSGQLEYFLKAYQSGEIVNFESEIDFSGNQSNSRTGKGYFEVVLFSVKNDKNQIKGIIALSQEITNRKLSESKLIDQNRRMEEYAFTVSHIIRRPIANLISLTNLFENSTELSMDDQLTMAHIHESVKQLDEIIIGLNNKITSINTNSYGHKNYSD